eukprot:5421150-Prymnesium_polylepis.2
MDRPEALLADGGVVLHPIGAQSTPCILLGILLGIVLPSPCCVQATSKIYLGYILYINVIAKKSFNEAVSLAGDNYTSFNLTEWC